MAASTSAEPSAHYVRHRWPPTILMVSSGRVSRDTISLPLEAQFVPKPYFDGGLVRAVQGALTRISNGAVSDGARS